MASITSDKVKVHFSKKGNVCLLLKQEDLFPEYKAIKGDTIYVIIDSDLFQKIAETIPLKGLTIFDYDTPRNDEMFMKVVAKDGRIFSGHLQEVGR